MDPDPQQVSRNFGPGPFCKLKILKEKLQILHGKYEDRKGLKSYAFKIFKYCVLNFDEFAHFLKYIFKKHW